MNKHKAMKVTYRICKTNKILFLMFNTRNACKLEFYGHLWLTFLDQTQSHVVVFQ